MTRRTEGEQNPFFKRVEIVMKVQMGFMNVTQAARTMGITRAYYYELEEEILAAALKAATPKKRGPKKAELDPKMVEVNAKLKSVERDKELLEIKVKHLEQLQRDMVSKGIGVLREKKQRRTVVRGGYGKKVQQRVQAAGPLEAGRTGHAGRDDQGTLPGAGTQQGQPVPMEGKGAKEAGATEARGGGRRSDGLGGTSPRSSEGRNVGGPADLRGTRRGDPSKPGEHRA